MPHLNMYFLFLLSDIDTRENRKQDVMLKKIQQILIGAVIKSTFIQNDNGLPGHNSLVQ